MSDYIDRQAAIDAICEHGTDLERRGITVLAVANHKQVTVDLLEQLPSAEVEPVKRGRWVQISPARIYECSVCRQRFMIGNIETYRFCHVCGAKMEPISASPENGQEVEE